VVRKDFDQEMARLIAAYGKTKYPHERIEVFWQKFQFVPHRAFKQTILKLIAYEPYAPLFEKFEKDLKPFIQKSFEEEKNRFFNSIQDCTDCTNSGVIFMKRKSENYITTYAFKCRCERGHYLFPNYPELPENSDYVFANDHLCSPAPQPKKVLKNIDNMKQLSFTNF